MKVVLCADGTVHRLLDGTAGRFESEQRADDLADAADHWLDCGPHTVHTQDVPRF